MQPEGRGPLSHASCRPPPPAPRPCGRSLELRDLLLFRVLGTEDLGSGAWYPKFACHSANT